MPVVLPKPFVIRETRQYQRDHRFNLRLIAIAAFVGVIVCLIAFALSRKWPFSQDQVLQNLREASDSQVQIRSFRRTFFPTPGCILEGVTFHHTPGEARPLITIDKMIVEGNYVGLLAQHVHRITAQGFRVAIPPFGSSRPFHTSPSKTTIDEIVANGAALEFDSSSPGQPPLVFDIHEAFVRHVTWSGPLTYRVKVHNPQPPGEVSAQGKFGVWDLTDPGQTPLDGEYKFEQADLSVYDGISGTLSSTGKFSGKLAHVDISGSTQTPNFHVKSSSHSVPLTTQFSAYVDATRGDTFLNNVTADFWKTHLVAHGSIASSTTGKGKIALIDLSSNKARIEDILRLFITAERAPMSGGMTLQLHAEIPSGSEAFLKRVRLRGGFGIAGGSFSPSTQEGIDKLSAGARGENEKEKEDPETVLTNLAGKLNLAGGTATFSGLSFSVPGAAADMQGTYNILNHKIDLRGQMRVDSKISNTTNGSKAFFLKMMEPFFKKKRKGEIVPVRISGSYEHPTFGLDLDDKKAQKAPAP